MFDWRELLLRNQYRANQTDRSTLKVLEEQLLHHLPPIINVLNAIFNLPLDPIWSRSELGKKFKIILEGVEQRYLVAWNHVRNAQIQDLEVEYKSWYQEQLRSEESLYRNYCQWQEMLIQQHSQGWSSWILLGLREHPFPTREFEQRRSLTLETEFLLAEWFKCARPLIQTDLYSVLEEFYSFQAAFTHQTPFLPNLFQEKLNPSEKEILKKLEAEEFVEAARIFWGSVSV
jgi:hypothetical protein